jgi:3-oxoacid CoA-transferase B subunit
MAWTDEQIALRAAADIQPGWTINLGIGIPTLVTGFLTVPDVMIHSENGILGMGPQPGEGMEDPDIVDAGKNPATIVPGAAFMDSLTSFALIRGGRLDLSLMGAYQVSVDGDLANWRLPERRVGGIGGAADLVVGARRVWVCMRHLAKDGASKLVERCTYALTGSAVVSRVYTDLGVFGLANGRVETIELAPGVPSGFDPLTGQG